MEYLLFAIILLHPFIVMLAFAAVPTFFKLLTPRPKRSGEFVAEVWLDWEICRGSTMYRQRFRSQAAAARYAKRYAVILDALLPSWYWGQDWSGNRMKYRYDYAIRYGVRRLAEGEDQAFNPLLSTTLPGHDGYSGEHREAHPLNTPLQGSFEGYLV